MPSNIAVDKLTFKLDKGKTLGLIGANGAGKSTTIRMLMNFIRPDGGSICLLGQNPANHNIRKRVGYLPETPSFPSSLSVSDLIRFTGMTCSMKPGIIKERAEILLNELGLWAVRKKQFRTFSKGMMQRASLTLALLNDPDLLILDEPMSGLDSIGREHVIQLLEKLRNEGKTILFCSHILNDVDRLVDELLVLHCGKLVFHGVPQEFLSLQGVDNIEEAFVSCINDRSCERVKPC